MERFKLLEDDGVKRNAIFINDNIIVSPATSVPGLYTIKPLFYKESILDLNNAEFTHIAYMQRQLRIGLRKLFNIELCGLYFEEHSGRKVISYTIPFHIDRLKERFSIEPYQPYIHEYIESYTSPALTDKAEIFNNGISKMLQDVDIKQVLKKQQLDAINNLGQSSNLNVNKDKEKSKIEKVIDVLDEKDLPIAPVGKKYFVCIGGDKNFQGFLCENNISKGEFLSIHENSLDTCLSSIYDDGQIVVRQDAKYAIPGFYIVSTKEIYRSIDEMPLNLFIKCMILTREIKRGLIESSIDQTYMYNDEKLNSPASVHFWVLPIYKQFANNLNLNLSIYHADLWKYLDSYPRFLDTKQEILKFNKKMKTYLKDTDLTNELIDIGI